jgi:hypothetical protein
MADVHNTELISKLETKRFAKNMKKEAKTFTFKETEKLLSLWGK